MVKESRKALIRDPKPKIRAIEAKNSAKTTKMNDPSAPIPIGSPNFKFPSKSLNNFG